MDLNDKQKEAVLSDCSKVLVISGAGSGKTLVITERVKELIRRGVSEKDIVIITFTNLAAQEISQRISNDHISVSTIHGYCNRLLTSYGIDTSRYLRDENFDKLFPLIKENPQCIKPVQHLILDEAHDTSPEQFEFIFSMIKPKNWFLCADMKQTIYEWRGVRPESIKKLANNPLVKVYDLTYNYRNSTDILDFAKKIISSAKKSEYIDKSIPKRTNKGNVIVDKAAHSSKKDIVRYVKSTGEENYGKWFVLARTNKQLDDIADYFEEYNIPYFSFKQSELTLQELRDEMNKNQVILITIHSAKGLERDNVIVYGARMWSEEEIRLSYVAATRARNLLYWLKG